MGCIHITRGYYQTSRLQKDRQNWLHVDWLALPGGHGASVIAFCVIPIIMENGMWAEGDCGDHWMILWAIFVWLSSRINTLFQKKFSNRTIIPWPGRYCGSVSAGPTIIKHITSFIMTWFGSWWGEWSNAPVSLTREIMFGLNKILQFRASDEFSECVPTIFRWMKVVVGRVGFPSLWFHHL